MKARASATLPLLSPSLALRNPHVVAVARRPPRSRAAVAPAAAGVAAGGAVVVCINGLALTSEANSRGHTKHAKSGRNARVRAATARAFVGVALPPLPLRVCVTRVAPVALDSDNVHGSGAKACRDELADVLGLPSDRDPRVTWRVMQARGPVGVRVTLVPRCDRARVETGEGEDVVTLRLTEGERSTLARVLMSGRGGRVVVGNVVLVMEDSQ